MSSVLTYKSLKNSFWILSFSLCLFSQILLLFHTSSFACSVAFQEITPEQLRNRLLSLAENKKEDIQNLSIKSCGLGCLSFYSSSGVQFKIKTDFSVSEPEIVLSSSSKTLRIPSSLDWLHKSSSDNYLKSWLVGSEIHPYTNASKNIQHTEAQNVALKAFRQALGEGAKSFLHIAPSNAGKTLVLAKALKEKLQNHRTNKISLVTVHQVHLVDQLFDSIQRELRGLEVTVINWNKNLNRVFSAEIERSVMRSHPTVLVITSHSLKAQLGSLQNRKPEIYDKLVKNTDGIYIDKAHRLGAFHTRLALLTLRERSGALLYGDTATPVHREVNIRDFFEREHWSYLNGTKKEAGVEREADQATRTTEPKREERGETEDLFYSHSVEKIMEQLFLGISKGEITFFDDLYIIKESSFNVRKNRPVFIQSKSRFLVLNPYYYSELTGLLQPILRSNKKGFIVTATISEANRLTQFLNKAIEGIQFEAYHSGLSKKQRQEVFRNSEEMESHYIVAVKALDEGVNLSHLSAYIDLNANVSVKQMIHRIGRVLRLHTGKLKSDVLFLADYRNAEMAKALLSLLEAVNLLYSRGGIKHRDESGDAVLKIPEAIPLGREELQRLREELRQSVQSFWDNKIKEKPAFRELIKDLIKWKVTTDPEWQKQRASNPALRKYPKNLTSYKEWKGWRYFRKIQGLGRPPFKELIKDLIKRGIIKDPEWQKQRASNPALQKYPKNVYKYKEWKGWLYFRKEILGIQDKPSFKELIEDLIKWEITKGLEWERQRASNPALRKYPKNLTSYKEWKGWRHFRGEKPRVKKPAFRELIKDLIKWKVTTDPEWQKQRASNPALRKYPKNLTSYKEWKGWRHFRGEKPRVKKPPFKELIKDLKKWEIIEDPEWQKKRAANSVLQKYPKDLYKYKEWKGWKHFRKEVLQVEDWPPFDELIKDLIRKKIKGDSMWRRERINDPELRKYPRDLFVYKEWKGWRHFHGKKPRIRNKPPFRELIKDLIKWEITEEPEWQMQRVDNPALQKYPRNLYAAYTEWKGWKSFKEQLRNGNFDNY